MGQTKTRTTAGASAHLELSRYYSVMGDDGSAIVPKNVVVDNSFTLYPKRDNSYTLYSKQINTMPLNSVTLSSKARSGGVRVWDNSGFVYELFGLVKLKSGVYNCISGNDGYSGCPRVY